MSEEDFDEILLDFLADKPTEYRDLYLGAPDEDVMLWKVVAGNTRLEVETWLTSDWRIYVDHLSE